jgi:hypothetical protein
MSTATVARSSAATADYWALTKPEIKLSDFDRNLRGFCLGLPAELRPSRSCC